MNRANIRAAILRCAEQGFAFSTAEFEIGASGLAVPIRDVSGTQAVLSTSATANQFAQEHEVDRILDILRRAAMGLRP